MHANLYDFSSSGTGLVSRRYARSMYSPSHTHFFTDWETCIEGMVSYCLPGTVDTAKALMSGSSTCWSTSSVWLFWPACACVL